jgi:tetratricopeptide (TPR) repeat protein
MLPAEGRFPQLQGDIEMAEAKPREALPYYEKAMALSPDYFGAFLGAGIATYRLGDKVRAHELLKRSAELLPTAPAAYYLGHLSRDGGDRASALEYFKAASGAGGELGKQAAAEYLALDLPQNPSNYVAIGAQFDATGRAMITVQNRAPVAIEGIEITPVMVDDAGQIVQQGTRRTLPLKLQPGEAVSIDAGLGRLDAAQAAQLRIRVDAARAVAAPPAPTAGT